MPTPKTLAIGAAGIVAVGALVLGALVLGGQALLDDPTSEVDTVELGATQRPAPHPDLEQRTG